MYSVISVKLDSLPGNTKKQGDRPVRGRSECNFSILGRIILEICVSTGQSSYPDETIFVDPEFPKEAWIISRRNFYSTLLGRKKLASAAPKEIRLNIFGEQIVQFPCTIIWLTQTSFNPREPGTLCGILGTPARTCLKYAARGLSWKLVWIFGSGNYFKSSLLCL